MQTIKATGLHRKSGGAQWRDLRFSGPFLEMFFLEERSVVEEPPNCTRKAGFKIRESALSKNISKKGPLNRRSLHYAALRSR